MDRYFVLSGGLHFIAFLMLMLCLNSTSSKPSATYTIDFIGSGKVIATTGQDIAKPQPATPTKETVQTPAPKEPEAPKKSEVKTPAKKAYSSKSEITTKKQQAKKEQPKPAPLAAPSILNEQEEKPASSSQDSSNLTSSKEGEFEGGNIQTDFANFPYPWYITQVRNALWIEWEKRRPEGNTLSALVSFAIARDGKIKNLKIEKKSGDDTYDFAASSAVVNAGPFQPLPMYYEKDELTISVEFKQEN